MSTRRSSTEARTRMLAASCLVTVFGVACAGAPSDEATGLEPAATDDPSGQATPAVSVATPAATSVAESGGDAPGSAVTPTDGAPASASGGSSPAGAGSGPADAAGTADGGSAGGSGGSSEPNAVAADGATDAPPADPLLSEGDAAGGAGGDAAAESAEDLSAGGAGGASPNPNEEPDEPDDSGDEGVGAGGMPGDPGEVASPVDPELTGAATRPQLTEVSATAFTIREYLRRVGDLAQGLSEDPWDPTAGVGDLTAIEPNYRVAASGGTHASVQAAIDAAVASDSNSRVYIELALGTYREVVCVPSAAPPITLYGSGPDASATTIVFDNYSGKPKPAGTSANPCNPSESSTTYGTSGSATFAAYADDFHAQNLTFANDTDESSASGGVQAVALMTQGDRLIFEDVRVLGNQDSLYLRTANAARVSRAYFKNSYIEGDTDFIFGRATFVLDGCTIHSVTNRTSSGVVAAPSTDARNPYGILFIDSTFTADAGAGNGSIHLARAWDESQGDVATYRANVASGVYPNGQTTFRNCELGSHIAPAPYRDAATTARPYSSIDSDVPANRFYEFENTGPGAAD